MAESERGIPLVSCIVGDKPTITVELYVKWYVLYLVDPVEDKVIRTIDFGELQETLVAHRDKWNLGKSEYCDHVPNPEAVEVFAEIMGYEVDDLALDLIAGRWQREVVSPDGWK